MTLLLVCNLNCYFVFVSEVLEEDQQLLLQPTDKMEKRVSAGVTVTGLTNILAGFIGVIGPVNYALSTGVIASTGIASRFTLVPTGIALIVISFMPGVVSFISGIPPLIIGVVFLYIMCTQIAAGLTTAFASSSFIFEDGLIIGVPLMLGLIVSFLPEAAIT